MFNKNIAALEKYNKTLANKIKKVSLKNASECISVLKNEKGEYILLQNEKYIDDIPSPLSAAKNIYDEQVKKSKSRYDFIIIFGLGIANLLDYVYNKSICSLVLYESDMNILRFTFEYVDLTKYFDSGRLYLTDNISDCANYINNKYLIDDKVEFVYLKNYLMMHTSEFTVLTEKIYQACENKIIDLNTIKKISKEWSKNILTNAASNNKNYPVNILENKFKNQTALILGAGPSLKDNIEKIKQNRSKYVIFAVNRTLETLRNNEITPDFCVVIDSNWTKVYFPQDENYLSQINLIADIKADSYLKLIPCQNFFTYYSENNIYSNKLKIKLYDDIKLLETGGTSTICAYRCAKLMGFKKIIFAGLDLAFKNDTAYCDGKIACANNQNSIKIQGVIMPVTEVKSITGEYVKTRTDYANFIRQFEILFAKDKTSELYNLSAFGAFINGMKYCPMENILDENTVYTEKTLAELTNKYQDLPEKIKDFNKEILAEERNKIAPITESIKEWFEMYSQHPLFFEYATKIITKITSTMMLQDLVQVEIMKFTKLVLSSDNETKKLFVTEMFTNILAYSKSLDNLI